MLRQSKGNAVPIVRDLLYRHASPYEGFPAEEFAPDASFPWTANHPALENAIALLRPARIIEVGSWTGGSAIRMGRACRDLGLATEIVCVDTWLGSPLTFGVHALAGCHEAMGYRWGYPTLFYTFLRNVVDAGLEDYITPMPLPSESAAVWFRNEGITAPLIYIDADHEYETVMRDLEVFWPLLDDGGILVGDDMEHEMFPGVERAARVFALWEGLALWSGGNRFAIAKRAQEPDGVPLGNKLGLRLCAAALPLPADPRPPTLAEDS
jgi:hypothetical protein